MKMKIFIAVVITAVMTIVSIGNAFAGPGKADFNGLTEVTKPVTEAGKPTQRTEITPLKNSKAIEKGASSLQGKESQDMKRRPGKQKQKNDRGKAVVRALVWHLNDVNLGVRRQAYMALKRIDKPALPSLTVALKRRNALVRSQAAKLLGEITAASASRQKAHL